MNMRWCGLPWAPRMALEEAFDIELPDEERLTLGTEPRELWGSFEGDVGPNEAYCRLGYVGSILGFEFIEAIRA